MHHNGNSVGNILTLNIREATDAAEMVVAVKEMAMVVKEMDMIVREMATTVKETEAIETPADPDLDITEGHTASLGVYILNYSCEKLNIFGI